jgi:winged helix DNA-binding protein
VGPIPVINAAQRRARLGRRHQLASSERSATPVEVARGLVGLHATDPATVYLSAAARLRKPVVCDIESALYDDKELIRMLGMRRTMFVVPREVAPIIQSACTRAIAAQERRRTVQLFGDAGLADDLATWLVGVENATFEALEKRGEATAQELGQDVPDLRKQVLLAAGKNYAALQGIASRILFQMSADGRIIRGRPRGSWISSQYRWAPIDAWLPDALPDYPVAAAQAELIRFWLRSFGPGTLADLKWWTGLSMGEVKRALTHLAVEEVDLGEGRGVVLGDDVEPEPPCEPWVALLPGLDATPMGYADRGWFLGSHRPAVFDRSGNIGPTVWSDGRVVGGWAQRKNGAIVYKLLEDVGAQTEKAIAEAAHDLTRWLGEVRITPRFRTPLERELSA